MLHFCILHSSAWEGIHIRLSRRKKAIWAGEFYACGKKGAPGTLRLGHLRRRVLRTRSLVHSVHHQNIDAIRSLAFRWRHWAIVQTFSIHTKRRGVSLGRQRNRTNSSILSSEDQFLWINFIFDFKNVFDKTTYFLSIFEKKFIIIRDPPYEIFIIILNLGLKMKFKKMKLNEIKKFLWFPFSKIFYKN
jgi:hypothetical protein